MLGLQWSLPTLSYSSWSVCHIPWSGYWILQNLKFNKDILKNALQIVQIFTKDKVQKVLVKITAGKHYVVVVKAATCGASSHRGTDASPSSFPSNPDQMAQVLVPAPTWEIWKTLPVPGFRLAHLSL